MSEPVRSQFDLKTGEISVLASGPESGPPIVCFHGIPTGAELWRGMLKELGKAGYKAYAPDLPGYGQTRLNTGGDYSLEGAAEFVASWMQEMDIAPAAMIAHDIGGGVLQILAVKYPELVDQLVFSDSIAGDSWPVKPIKLLQWIARLRIYPLFAASGLHDYEPFLNRQLKRAFAKPSLLRDKEFRRRIFFDSKVSNPKGRHAFANHLRALDPCQTVTVESDLAEIEVPVFLLWGRKDPFQPFNGPGERLRRHFPEAEVEVLDGAGHFPMLDAPETYSNALISWLDSRTIKNGWDLLT